MRKRSFAKIFMLLTLAFWWGYPTVAQQNITPPAPTWQVFLQRKINRAGVDRLVFINAVTNDEQRVEVTGERYTPISGAILYFDLKDQRVKIVTPDGVITEHPFIQPEASTRRVDWLVSADGKQLAWTLTNAEGARLKTVTSIANIDGTNPRALFSDGPRDSIRALPVAFSPDNTTLYMDFQPDGVAAFTPFRQYAGLFAVDTDDGQWVYLPDEPSCFCGAGFGAGVLLRLNVAQDLSGFDLRVVSLPGNVQQTIPALRLRNFTQAGDIIVSPDGQKAVYALAQVRNFGRPNQSVRTVFVLVDLQLRTQTPLTQPITTYVQPLAWTEDDSAVIFTSPQRDGTWKVNLGDGKLDKIAEATYVGALR
jgi:hypothetical protein